MQALDTIVSDGNSSPTYHLHTIEVGVSLPILDETDLMNHVSGSLIFFDDDENQYTLNQLMSYLLYKARFKERTSFKGVNMRID